MKLWGSNSHRQDSCQVAGTEGKTETDRLREREGGRERERETERETDRERAKGEVEKKRVIRSTKEDSG